MATKQQIYINQISRLQERNILLAEILAEERSLRKKAYSYYRKRVNSRFWSLFDMIGMAAYDLNINTKRK